MSLSGLPQMTSETKGPVPDPQRKRSFAPGDVIMRQGDRGGCAYIIEKGKVEILMDKPGGDIHRVGTRGPGTLVGEMAIVDDAPRTATVKALEACQMLEISRDDFLRRLKSSDPVLQIVTQVILTRYRDMLTRAEIHGETSGFPTPEDVEKTYMGQTDAVDAIKIANEFKEAMDKGELSLHYQPIVDLGSGQLAGFEALMRWKHPERGFISPAIFIPVAEETGLIVSASSWALREACQALKRVEARGKYLTPLFMSVNFSSTDFASGNFVETVYNILSATDVSARQVHLEITERTLIAQPDNARDTLEMCRKAGMGISIDDFGTGYSSLSYLHYFPIDTLKIDRAFVKDMTRETGSRELVRSIVTLGKNLGMKIIAEGVETLEEAVLLRAMGCDMAQGYYFAKPLAEADLHDAILAWRPLRLSSANAARDDASSPSAEPGVPEAAALPLIRPDLSGLEPYASAGMEAGKRADTIYMNASENPYALPGLKGLNRYPEPQPAALVAALADLYGVEPRHLMVTRGEDEAIDLLVRSFCVPNRDAVLTCPPTFPMYAFAARLQNAQPVEVPLIGRPDGTFALDTDGIKAALADGSRTIRVVFLCSPNNPTGGSIDRKAVLDVCRAARGRAAVVLDEAYAEFSDRPSLIADLNDCPNLVILRTLSKAHALAGERIGSVLSADTGFMDFLRRMIAPYPIPRTAIDSALTALSPENRARTRETVDLLRAERARLAKALAAAPGVKRVYPSDANFLLVAVEDPKGLVAHCAAGKLIIRDRSGVPGLEGCVRISIGTPEENDAALSLVHEHARLRDAQPAGRSGKRGK